MSSSDPASAAQKAFERGDPDALALFDHALRSDPGNAKLHLGKARALELNGDVRGARIVAEQLARQAPGFLAAQALLAQLRLAAGEADFTAHYDTAAKRNPQDPNIPAAHAQTLAGLDYAARAAEVVAEARNRFPHEPHFALLEAVHSGAAGEWDRAQAIFASLDYDTADRKISEARHRLRACNTEAAISLLDEALTTDPWDIAAWALRGICWRVSEHPHSRERAEWLHEQAGLVQMRPLLARNGLLDDAIDVLRVLHETAAMPLGQSLRGGTQTRGILFLRTDPVLSELQSAIYKTIEAYRADLPSFASSHPLLRHRDAPWQLAGSWSVRMRGGGDYHTAHIHPQGIVSSALYMVLPEQIEVGARQGLLEIGRPPQDLGLNLSPIRTIEPRQAHLALFPSTLYHGTTQFGASASGERLTVAFDVVSDID